MSKKNSDLKRQIKEMEDKARAEAMAAAGVSAEAPAQDAGVSYDQWWMMINAKVKMRPYLKEIVLADFQARGLSKKETQEKYDAALRLFGYSW